ncbi:hypothetical protein GCM10010469_34660 [Streptomyces labedae]|uniref:Uncharacterized protein n=2 Tax=Streptomyces TaxID=1883 RepID=A0ABQ2U2Y2_9ACTN|nr:hypothetical protein GCM10010265_59300 [Streptomyces griseoincarnatus]GGT59020.1 hypothetical protein GCM10010287_36480 [Streptomyces variabilis]
MHLISFVNGPERAELVWPAWGALSSDFLPSGGSRLRVWLGRAQLWLTSGWRHRHWPCRYADPSLRPVDTGRSDIGRAACVAGLRSTSAMTLEFAMQGLLLQQDSDGVKSTVKGRAESMHGQALGAAAATRPLSAYWF